MEQVNEQMFNQQYYDFRDIDINVLKYLNDNYNVICVPRAQTWQGVRKGLLQDIDSIYKCLYDEECTYIGINDKYMFINTSHHDGNNSYTLLFATQTLEEYYNNKILDSDYWSYDIELTDKQQQYFIENYCVSLVDLYKKGLIF